MANNMDHGIAVRLDELRELEQGGGARRAMKRALDLAREFSPEDKRRENERKVLELLSAPAQGAAGEGRVMELVAGISETLSGEPLPVESAPSFIGKNIKRAYGGARGKGFCLDIQESIELRPGEITGLVGENGSGKTTLLRIIVGELAVDSGELEYPRICPGKIDWRLLRNRIAYVPQRPQKWYGSLGDNLNLYASLRGITGSRNEHETEFLLRRYGFWEKRDAKWSELTGGFLSRFELVKAMLKDPDIVVLDEPLAPLDIRAMHNYLLDARNIADSFRKPVPVILSSQHLHEVESVADRLLMLDDGAVKYYGSATSLSAEKNENTFELSCGCPAAGIRKILSAVHPEITVAESGFNALVSAPVDVEGAEILAALLKAGMKIEYFRDISASTRKMFGSGGEA